MTLPSPVYFEPPPRLHGTLNPPVHTIWSVVFKHLAKL